MQGASLGGMSGDVRQRGYGGCRYVEKIKKGTPHARFPSGWFDLKNDLAGCVQSLVEILVRVDKGDHAR
ncbi:hypothetical protein, partial [Desulfovibrio sp.]|uniref:hypothetical protein n=1 Tax=Desulfovibrio sp. TaxID=885 RepID=UPI0026094C84